MRRLIPAAPDSANWSQGRQDRAFVNVVFWDLAWSRTLRTSVYYESQTRFTFLSGVNSINRLGGHGGESTVAVLVLSSERLDILFGSANLNARIKLYKEPINGYY